MTPPVKSRLLLTPAPLQVRGQKFAGETPPRNPCRASTERQRLRWLPRALFLFILMGSRVFALDPAKSLFQYNCQNWTRQTGLPANKINAVAQSRDGYIWLSTQNGLVRFDGVEF